MAQLLAGGAQDDDAPAAGVGASGRVALHGEAEMRLAIGANWDAYRSTWLAMRDSPGLRPGFSAAALLLQGVWLLYRKQWAAFFGLLALSSAVVFATPGSSGGLGAMSASIAPQSLLMLAISVALAVFGKSYVVLRAIRMVERVKAQGLPAPDAARLIERKGGVSYAAPIGFFLAATLLFAALFGGLLLAISSGLR